LHHSRAIAQASAKHDDKTLGLYCSD
jgi:hypothetical protein